jgi:DNA repair protein RecN (Recombination protein N)
LNGFSSLSNNCTMLSSLHLKDFVIVDALSIDFKSGFSVLTGETGAGKSILLDAIGLVTGGRADSGAVREGQPRADISAEFSVDADLEQWLAERDLSGDAGVLQLRRVIDADGRSRAFINSHPSTAAMLKQLGERLIDIHGQHAAQSLMRGEGQRELLDSFAGIEVEVKELAARYKAWTEAEHALKQAQSAGKNFEQERDRLAWQLNELKELKLVKGEWEQLNVEQKRLANAAQLIEIAQGASGALSDDDDAIVNRLQTVAQKLKNLVAIDSSLKPCLDLIESAAIQLDEASSDLSSYAQKIELDPARLQEIDQRTGSLFSAARKFKIQPELLFDEQLEFENRLSTLTASQDLSALAAKVSAAQAHYGQLAEKLSLARKKSAVKLSKGVSAHLQSLGMKGAKMEIAIADQSPASHGTDHTEFQVAGHEGVAARAISKVASGGELSRIGLAIAVLAAQANPVPTLIFDEADAGIGGSVAEVVGKLMRTLGDSRQVLSVTHLPQVAACAHHQFKVMKQSSKGKTISQVAALTDADRVDEVARMLGGIAITDTTRKHASELLNHAVV